MLIKSIDEKGNRAVGNYPDDSNFIIEQDREGLCYIAAHLPRPVPPQTLPVQRVVSALDKKTANRCIDKIYDQLKSKEKDCDLTVIQLKISEDSDDETE